MWTPLEKLTSRLRRTPVSVTIHADEERIVIARSNREECLSFAWHEVDEVETFKRDLLTTDDIRLAFLVSGVWYEVSEGDAGFMPLAELMRAKLPSIDEDWYFEVMQPPFATNQRTLWKRG